MANHPRPAYLVRVARPRINLALGAQPVNRLLLPIAAAGSPFSLNDWPGPRRVVPTRAQSQPLNLNLLGQDRFFAAPGMGPQYFFPSPRVQRARAADWSPNLLPLYSQLPFNAGAWENPARRRYQPPAFFSTGLALYASIQASGPFNQFDWPPSKRARQVRADTYGLTALFIPPPAPLPFNRYDWPNPLRPRLVRADTYPLTALTLPPTPIPPEPPCVHEVTAEPLSALTLTAGSLNSASLTASPLTATTITAEPPC